LFDEGAAGIVVPVILIWILPAARREGETWSLPDFCESRSFKEVPPEELRPCMGLYRTDERVFYFLAEEFFGRIEL